MYGGEIRELEEGCWETEVIQKEFCNKVFRVPRFSENRTADWTWEIQREGKVVCLDVKYWLRILQMEMEELVKGCYEWQINILKFNLGKRNDKEKIQTNDSWDIQYLARSTE